MGRSTGQALGFACFFALVVTALYPGSSRAEADYDVVVDVTGMDGRDACRAMQGALNKGLTDNRSGGWHVLLKGRLGSAESPANFSMFHNTGKEGASGKAWPYSVCHAFWPIRNANEGEGVVEGYPDPFYPRVLKSSKAIAFPDSQKVKFRDPICESFVFGRIRAEIVSGQGEGQMRLITGCDSSTVAAIESEWEAPPDSSSTIRLIDWHNPRLEELDLRVHYDLDVFYENSAAQAAGEYGVFADVGLHCYFTGAPRGGDVHRGCLTRAADGIQRSGRIRIREIGQRDDGEDCRPTWPGRARLMNRDYSIIWQALGPAVTRGSDDTELLIFGDGDRDNVGVLLFNTWTKDFRRWRIRGIGTGLWIAGSLNNTLYDPYIAGNQFGVVVGSNEAWGTGWPRWESCFSGNCDPAENHWTGMTFRGGVVEGNSCGNFVMFGGYSGEVDRTFVEPGYKDSPLYAGHSILVGAGVCDGNTASSPRQKVDRAGRVCGDDQDCGGVCVVNDQAKRTYSFNWDAVVAGNRGDSRWYSFMLGKGTQANYLRWWGPPRPHIRVAGAGLGGESGHGKPDLKFYAAKNAQQPIDVGEVRSVRSGSVLPAYGHYVGMPRHDLQLTIPNPASGVYELGELMDRSTCTEAGVALSGGTPVTGRWSIRHGSASRSSGLELIEGGSPLPGRGRVVDVGAPGIDNPYVDAGSRVWLELSVLAGKSQELRVSLRCWDDQ